MKRCFVLVRGFVTTSFLCAGLLVSGCATHPTGADAITQEPRFDLFAFFEGDTKAWGIVQNRSGDVIQRFTVDLIGSVEGDRLTLDETFHYQQGEGVTTRVWTIDQAQDGSYSGSATDIPGPARGRSFGNAFQWRYTMDLPVGDSTYSVNFEDWIWQLDPNTLVNRSYIQKLGLDFAEVTLFMQRQN